MSDTADDPGRPGIATYCSQLPVRHDPSTRNLSYYRLHPGSKSWPYIHYSEVLETRDLVSFATVFKNSSAE
jgi:hypothetical protein